MSGEESSGDRITVFKFFKNTSPTEKMKGFFFKIWTAETKA